MWRVTPWSRKSCTRKEVASTSCAILSITSTFHVGRALLVVVVEGFDDDETLWFWEGVLLRDKSVLSWWICRSRRVLIVAGSSRRVRCGEARETRLAFAA